MQTEHMDCVRYVVTILFATSVYNIRHIWIIYTFTFQVMSGIINGTGEARVQTFDIRSGDGKRSCVLRAIVLHKLIVESASWYTNLAAELDRNTVHRLPRDTSITSLTPVRKQPILFIYFLTCISTACLQFQFSCCRCSHVKILLESVTADENTT
jgi:hypothetical protein